MTGDDTTLDSAPIRLTWMVKQQGRHDELLQGVLVTSLIIFCSMWDSLYDLISFLVCTYFVRTGGDLMSVCGSFDQMCVGIKLYVCFVFEAVPHFSHTDKDISKLICVHSNDFSE